LEEAKGVRGVKGAGEISERTPLNPPLVRGEEDASTDSFISKAQDSLTPPLPRREEDASTDSFISKAQDSLTPPLPRGVGGVKQQTPTSEDFLATHLRVKIPVLVELRYYCTSILDLIQDFLKRHDPNLEVDANTLKTWLRQGQLLLLLDGVNELPSLVS